MFTFYFYSSSLVETIFGEAFSESGNILKYLIFFSFFTWISLPFTTVAQALNLENILIYSLIIMSLLNVSLNIMFYHIYGLIGIAYSTLVVYSIGSLFQILVIYRNISDK